MKSERAVEIRTAFFVLAIAAIVRGIPEILAGAYPIGFDTVTWYAPFLSAARTQGIDVALTALVEEQTAPGLYLLLVAFAPFPSISPWTVVKVLGPLLLGVLAVVVYAFGRTALEWPRRKAFLGATFAVLLFAVLRMSWDEYRGILGYSLFLVAFLAIVARRPRYGMFVAASLGVAVTHELASALLFLTLLGFVAVRGWRTRSRGIQLAVLGLLLIALLYYAHWIIPVSRTTDVFAGPVPAARLPIGLVDAGLLAAFWVPIIFLATILYHFALVGLPFLPALRGAGPPPLPLLLWIAPLAFLSTAPIWSPFAAAPVWERWVLMLSVPLGLWAFDGLRRLSRRKAAGVILVVAIMSAGFLVPPPEFAFPLYATPATTSHMPSSMVQSTIPLSDVPGVLALAEYFQRLRIDGDVLYVHLVFSGWVRVGVPAGPYAIYLHWADVQDSARWVIWWLPGEGWYPDESPDGRFVPLATSGHVALYRYVG